MENSMILNLTIELFFGFIGLLIAVKIIGNRQVQQVSAFDFVSAVVLGELLGNAIYNNETKIFHVIYALALWTFLLFAIEKIAQKSKRFRNAVEGTPKLVIKDGLIDYNVLKHEKLSFDELLSELRNRGAFSIREVQFAIIEPNGVITVIKKSLYQNAVKSDFNIEMENTSLNLPIVLEGKILSKNLEAIGYNEQWLINLVRKQNVKNIKEILYAEWNENQGLYIQQRKGQ